MEYFLLAICVGLILCPTRYDPVIRWKEYNENLNKTKG